MCGGSGEGGGRGAKPGLGRRLQAGHPGRGRCVRGRAAAAQVGAGGGARCTVTRSCAPWPRGDIHRPAGPGSASAPRAAHGSAVARGPRTAPRFAPSYFDGRWETAGGVCPADKGRTSEPRESRVLSRPLLRLHRATRGNLGRVVGTDCGTGRCAEKGGDPEPQTQPRRRPGAGEAGEQRSCLQNLKEKFGASRLPAGPWWRSPVESGRQWRWRRRSLHGRGPSPRDFSGVISWPGVGAEQRL